MPRNLSLFELQDQFGRTYTDQSLAGTNVIVVGCDKDGSRFGGAWFTAFRDSTRKAVVIEPGRPPWSAFVVARRRSRRLPGRSAAVVLVGLERAIREGM